MTETEDVEAALKALIVDAQMEKRRQQDLLRRWERRIATIERVWAAYQLTLEAIRSGVAAPVKDGRCPTCGA